MIEPNTLLFDGYFLYEKNNVIYRIIEVRCSLFYQTTRKLLLVVFESFGKSERIEN